MPADPIDTHSLTTHPEHLAEACERTETADEITRLRAELGSKQNAYDVLWAAYQQQTVSYSELDRLRAENDSLRSQLACQLAERKAAAKRLARAEAIEAAGDAMHHAGDELLGYIEGGFSLYHDGLACDELASHSKALVAWSLAKSKFDPGCVDRVSSSDPCPDCGSSRWTPDGDCPACVRRDADDPILYSLGAAPSQTEAEREVTRLREECERLGEKVKVLEAASDRSADRAARQQQKIEDRNETIETLRSEFTRVSRAKQQQIDNAMGTLANTADRLMAAQKENADLRTEADTLRSQITRESWIEGNDALREENELLTRRLADSKAEIDLLLTTVANHEEWSAETAKRCEAVFKAADCVNAAYMNYSWVGAQEAAWSRFRKAVDALRPATATETHS